MLLYLIKQKMQNYNDIKQLALLYFEGKAALVNYTVANLTL